MPPMPVEPGDYPPMPEYDAPPVEYGDVHIPPSVQEDGLVMNEPSLAPCEKEILRFVLESGCTELLFDVDSRFYVKGETVNVAEFIDSAFAEDGAEFYNEPYRRVYEEYFRMYDEGLTQQQIQSRLLNSMDPVISEVAKDLLIEKHQITVKNYESSLTAESTRLVQFVPKALMVYQSKKLELILKDLTVKLAAATDEEEQAELLVMISDYSKARTRLNNELGRV
jgi:hypothetical protein